MSPSLTRFLTGPGQHHAILEWRGTHGPYRIDLEGRDPFLRDNDGVVHVVYLDVQPCLIARCTRSRQWWLNLHDESSLKNLLEGRPTCLLCLARYS